MVHHLVDILTILGATVLLQSIGKEISNQVVKNPLLVWKDMNLVQVNLKRSQSQGSVKSTKSRYQKLGCQAKICPIYEKPCIS